MPDIVRTSRITPIQTYEGTAAEDLPRDSTVLKVICPELTPHALLGGVEPGITSGNTSLKNRDGVTISSPRTTSNHIVATWEGSTNSRVPPMVRKGETVTISMRADQDKFYWSASGKGRSLRNTDRVQIEVGAVPDGSGDVEKNDTNTYSATLDSVSKMVSLKTSKANGEVAAFAMEANLNDGTFYVSDDNSELPNRFFMDSGAVSGTPKIQINTSTGATVLLEGDDLLITVPGKIVINGKDRIIFNSPLTIFNEGEVGNIMMRAKNLAFNAASQISLSSAVVGIKGVVIAAGGIISSAIKAATVSKGTSSGSVDEPKVRDILQSPVSEPASTPDTNLSGQPFITMQDLP